MADRKRKTAGVAGARQAPPTVADMAADPLTELANAHWAPSTPSSARAPFDAGVVDRVYDTELRTGGTARAAMLEFSCYLENYLWPYFDAENSNAAHIKSIMIMVNEKSREGVPAWLCFHEREDAFASLVHRVIGLWPALQPEERGMYIVFLINCFRSLEDALVRRQVLRLVSLSMWRALNPGRLQRELEAAPQLRKHWHSMARRNQRLQRDAAGSDTGKADAARRKLATSQAESTFMTTLVRHFLTVLAADQGDADAGYFERVVEFLIDLLSELPTRRFLHAVIEDARVVVRCRLAPLHSDRPRGQRFAELVKMLHFYEGFEIDDQTGAALSDSAVTARHCDRILALQRSAFQQFPELKAFALSHVGSLETRKGLLLHLRPLSDKRLREFCVVAGVLGPPVGGDDDAQGVDWAGEAGGESREFLLEAMVHAHERRVPQIETINEMPVYPNETMLWNPDVLPKDEAFHGDNCLPLPKLNMQFLTIRDYLLRNFTLFRLESAHEIREDIQDVVLRLRPTLGGPENDETVFAGWARMAVPIERFEFRKVARPMLGETKPAEVSAEVTYSITGMQGQIRSEWDGFTLHDVVFLLTLRAQAANADPDLPFDEQWGVVAVRGAEVQDIIDGEGNVTGESSMSSKPVTLVGNQRTLRVKMDAAQYRADLLAEELGPAAGHPQLYQTLNVLVRRRSKENNFKAVLETIRDLMNTPTTIPGWLHDTFLGYGDPAASLASTMTTIDFRDAFLDVDHALASFPGSEVAVDPAWMGPVLPPFRLTFAAPSRVTVTPYVTEYPGPYPFNQPRRNTIRFTPAQIEAVRQGVQPDRLTMVVGPPGTGKTDVAVQIVQTLYHNYPDQRTLLITHSNQALNQLFEKIMLLDVDERHLLRLGHGEELLETTKDFSKWGRINYMLARRLELLQKVRRLARTLAVTHYDVAQSCETAEHFFRHHVMPRWGRYVRCLHGDSADWEQEAKAEAAAAAAAQARRKTMAEQQAESVVEQDEDEDEDEDEDKKEESKTIKKEESPREEDRYTPDEWVARRFPFLQFLSDAPQPVFPPGGATDAHIDIARGCWRYIAGIFEELKEMRPFELLKSGWDRTNYMLTTQARIVAMTCTHAAINRRRIVDIGFRFDTIVMEEAAQVLEVETAIPLLMQVAKDGQSRLKRVVLLGDHHQLPPVVQNPVFQSYSHLDQSLFSRFVRLGVPHVLLDKQGRARSEIAALYNWRYERLGDLPRIREAPEYHTANAGFAHNFQFVDVGDLNRQGESQPNPHFFQNVAEAEYIVSVYMYMRLLGYPPERISLLTTYNGQKHLLRDVVARRCRDPLFGYPRKITTVDRYQGQENDYVLLSLVRTRNVGHLRDIRRLVVAMSRARLGLYVFGRLSLFANCFELSPAFAVLQTRPVQLRLALGETFSTTQRTADAVPESTFDVQDVLHMSTVVSTMFRERMNAFHAEQAKVAAAWEEERRASEAATAEMGAEEEEEEEEDGTAAKRAKVDGEME